MAESAKVAVLGASGYVGRRLTAALTADGTEVVALGRHADRLPDGELVDRRSVDATDQAATAEALRGCSVAYYLAHAMAGGEGFADRDREMAATFAGAAAQAGLRRIVYLGGLGSGELSEHLRSRQEVGSVLGSAGVAVVELRAAIILGAGSISFEMLRYLTERLPVMICPRWVRSRVQPIAERDLLAYLAQARDVPPGVYEIGGPDALTYQQMMQVYARVRGLRRRRIARVPLLTPALSSHWVNLITPVDRAVSRSLVDSLRTDVVVGEPGRTSAVFDVAPLPVAEAITAALDEQADRVSAKVLDFDGGLLDGVYAFRSEVPMGPRTRGGAVLDLNRCGGDLGWYGLAWAWWLRILLGRLFGERLTLHHPDDLEVGARVDWWTVRGYAPNLLVLRTDQWFCGEAWLAYEITDSPDACLRQVGALRPRGLLGWVYWRLLWPIHQVVFRVMVRRQRTRARALAAARR